METNSDKEIIKAKEQFLDLLTNQHVENLEIISPQDQETIEKLKVKDEDLEDLNRIPAPSESVLLLPDGAEIIDNI
jgi:hypothetical protein